MKRGYLLATVFSAFLLAGVCCPIGEVSAQTALSGKAVVYTTTQGQLRESVNYLKAIRATHENLTRQALKPDIVFIFYTLTPEDAARTRTGDAAISQRLRDEFSAIMLDMQKRLGVRMEADAASLETLPVSVRKKVKLIDDPLFALMQYQAKGYSLIPVYASPGPR